MRRPHTLLLPLLLLPGLALGDAEPAALTLTPWSGTALTFTDEDARFAGAFAASLGRGLWGSAELAVPLNPVGDQTVLVDSNGAVSGFTGRLGIGYDSTYRLMALAATEDLQARMAFCQKYNLTDCTDTAIQTTLDGIEDALDHYHNVAPSPEVGWHYSVAVELVGAYAGVSALESPTASTLGLYHDYTMDGSLAGTFFWERLIVSLRPGLSLGQDVSVAEIERCTVPGEEVQVCTTALSLQEVPEAVLAGHLRTAVTIWDTSSHLSGELAPGIELRTNLEGLGAGDPIVNLRLTGFLGPKAWPLGLRSGLGLDVDLGLAPELPTLRSVTPFAFIGATFDSTGRAASTDEGVGPAGRIRLGG